MEKTRKFLQLAMGLGYINRQEGHRLWQTLGQALRKNPNLTVGKLSVKLEYLTVSQVREIEKRIAKKGSSKTPSPSAVSTNHSHHFSSSTSPPEEIAPNLAPFDITRELGAGGHCVVYEGKDPFSKREVAIKILKDPRDMTRKKRFIREIQIASHLQHPSILPLYQGGYLREGQPYMIMKKIEKGTLADLLKKVNKGFQDFPLVEKIEIFKKILEGVEYAHSKGVIHRDLKPANIAISGYGEVLIMDFGIARLKGKKDLELEGLEELEELEERTDQSLANSQFETGEVEANLTQEGAMMGTAGYISPEQLKGKKADERSDIFALGVIFYQMLTLHRPFGGNVQQRISSTALLEPESPREIDESIPRELSAVAMKALEKKRALRYQTIGDLRRDLDAYLEGKSVSAKVDRPWERIWKWCKRNRALVLGVSACLLVFAGTAIAFYLHQKWERERRAQEKRSQLNRKYSQLYQEAETKWEKVLKAREWKKEFGPVRNFYGEEIDRARKAREKAMEELLDIRSLAARALELKRTKELKGLLWKLERELGRLALKGRDFTLARLSFLRLRELEPGQGKKWLEKLEVVKREQKRADLRELEKIWEKLGEYPREGEVEELVVRTLRKRGEHVVRKLLELLEKSFAPRGTEWQKRFCVEVLGKMGDRRTEWKGKDSVQWLMEKLKEVDLKKDSALAESLIWALGRLRDARADEIVFQTRLKSGQKSPFWDNTALPYSWIKSKEDQSGPQTKSTVYMQLWRRFLKVDSQREYKKLLIKINGALKKWEESADFLEMRAGVYKKLEKYDQALADYSRAIEILPEREELYKNRGQLYRLMGEFQKALSDYDKAIDLRPGYANAYCERGIVYKELKKYDEALADYNEAIKIEPKHALAYYSRGKIFKIRRNYDRALANFSKAIQLRSRFAGAYHSRAEVYRLKKNFEQALSDYSKAIKLQPRKVSAYNDRGGVHLESGNYDRALKDFEKALELDPNSGVTYFNLGIIYTIKKSAPKAIKNYSKALEHMPNNARIYYYRGRIYLGTGKYNKARVDFLKTIDLQPRLWGAHYFLGRTYLKLGQKEKARQSLQQALRYLPPGNNQKKRTIEKILQSL